MVRINSIFKRIDLNGNNQLEKEEITKVYGGKLHYSFILAYLLIYSLTYLLTCLLAYLLTHSLTHSLICLLGDAKKAQFMLNDVDINHDGTISPIEFQGIYILTHSFTYSLTHSLTHAYSLTRYTAYFLNVLKAERKGNDWSHGMDRVSNMLTNLEALLDRRDAEKI